MEGRGRGRRLSGFSGLARSRIVRLVTFRENYLDYEALTAQLRAWQQAHPSLVELRSLAKTPEGRDVWLLVVGPDPQRTRPAVWVDGNLHAGELAGSNVALSIADAALGLHTGAERPGLPKAHPISERLRDVLFYITPRISPDGAEAILKTGRYVRSVPRDERPDRGASRWLSRDVDGDGVVRMMRVRDAAGEFVESRQSPGLLVPREVGDSGPFYKLYPEGVIDNFDGRRVPAPAFFADNPVDLNRNFPWSWAPPHEQDGAGPFPTSEPESRALVEFATAHPEIFVWLNLHTFGGVGIRPLGHAPDAKMDPFDLAVYRQIGAWLEDLTGYPMVSGYHEFLYQPDRPLRGDLSEFAYHQRGAIGYVVELWDLFARLGIERPQRFVDHYFRFDRSDLERLAQWDAAENAGRVCTGWKPFEHPQLGPVEVGGIDPRVGIWNPPPDELAELCARHTECLLRVAALAPALELCCDEVCHEGGNLSRVEVKVRNLGYLPTHILDSAKTLSFAESLFVDCEPGGCELVDAGQARVPIGQLSGWGNGKHRGLAVPSHQRSPRGNDHEAHVSYLVRGTGELVLRAGGCRVGWVKRRVEVR